MSPRLFIFRPLQTQFPSIAPRSWTGFENERIIQFLVFHLDGREGGLVVAALDWSRFILPVSCNALPSAKPLTAYAL